MSRNETKQERGRWIRVPGRSAPVWEPLSETGRGEALPWAAAVPVTTRDVDADAEDLVAVTYRVNRRP